ncbi:Tetraspanin-17 [Sciurus carolinensis]|uniref:Tetraspanin-17 n=1 Tax=Sciurus carolinensis TaxID=30640 RepID=A0AA41SSF6_SCICA|nr:Tetraspanin-17 [Sciurus carolinensis]
MSCKYQHFQEPEVSCCGKYFLLGVNIVFWVLGALFLAIGLWVWRCGVPFCCIRDPSEDVLNTQCGYDVQLKLELEQQGSIHTKGCVEQLEKWLQDNLIVVAGVFVGIVLLQIFGICLTQNLVSDIKAVKAN